MYSRQKINMVGSQYGYLTVLREVPERNKRGHILYLCKCDCGNEKITLGASLRTGLTSSCNKCNNRKNVKHGMWKTREFNIWNSMIDRCHNPNGCRSANYYHKGITVCDRWKESFNNFYEDMGDSNGLTLDRINNDGNYEPSNCRWATQKTQARNRSNNKIITYKGTSKCISEWCEELKMPSSTFHNRILRGWTIDQIIETPIRNKK